MKISIKKLSATLFISCFILCSVSSFAQLKTTAVEAFEKVIISPHIAVTFIKGDSESVVIHSSNEPLDKLNIKVVGTTLRLYLDGAKTNTDRKKVKKDGYKYKKPIYKGTVVTATITYTELNELSLRGEEKFVCESPLVSKDFTLKIYGESQVYFNEINFDKLKTTIYGESVLEFKEGHIGRQKITAYGETKVNTLNIGSDEVKITAYGEGSYRVAVKDRLKVTAYGEASIAYSGSPEVDKGIIIGETTIQKIN